MGNKGICCASKVKGGEVEKGRISLKLKRSQPLQEANCENRISKSEYSK